MNSPSPRRWIFRAIVLWALVTAAGVVAIEMAPEMETADAD